jgi:tight adherence protein C
MTLPDTNIIMIMSIAAFLVFFMLSMGVAQVVVQRKKRLEVIRKISGGGERVDIFKNENIQKKEGFSLKRLFLTLFSSLGTRISPKESIDYSTVRLKFLRAGLRGEHAAAAFWGAKIYFALFMVIVLGFSFIVSSRALDHTVFMALSVAAGILGFYLPNIWLYLKASSRKDKVVEGLPDALDLLGLCIEAGLGWDSAINRVAKELSIINPVLSEEFRLMNLELRAGKARVDALRNLSLRTNSSEINNLVTLLIQTDQFGTSLVDAIRVYSDSYRTKRFQKAEEIAAKLPIKMLIPLALCILPSIFIVILGPAFITIYKTFVTTGIN